MYSQDDTHINFVLNSKLKKSITSENTNDYFIFNKTHFALSRYFFP